MTESCICAELETSTRQLFVYFKAFLTFSETYLFAYLFLLIPLLCLIALKLVYFELFNCFSTIRTKQQIVLLFNCLFSFILKFPLTLFYFHIFVFIILFNFKAFLIFFKKKIFVCLFICFISVLYLIACKPVYFQKIVLFHLNFNTHTHTTFIHLFYN